jgi:hypothetical protein
MTDRQKINAIKKVQEIIKEDFRRCSDFNIDCPNCRAFLLFDLLNWLDEVYADD